MNIIKRLWALLTNRDLIWVRAPDGEVTLEVAHIDPFGYHVVYTAWPFRNNVAVLLANGEVEDYRNVVWKYAHKRLTQ